MDKQIEGSKRMSALAKTPTGEELPPDQGGKWLRGNKIHRLKELRKAFDYGVQLFEVDWDEERAQKLAGNLLDLRTYAGQQQAVGPHDLHVRIVTVSDGQSCFIQFHCAPPVTGSRAPAYRILLEDGRPLPNWVMRKGTHVYVPKISPNAGLEIALQLIVCHPSKPLQRAAVNVDLQTSKFNAQTETTQIDALIFSKQLENAANGQVNALREMGEQLHRSQANQSSIVAN